MSKYQPGQSGNPNGRPKGSKHKLSEDLLRELAADFGANGPVVIQKVREEKPEVYLKVIASMVPKEMKLSGDENPYEGMTDEQLEQRLMEMMKENAKERGLALVPIQKIDAGEPS